MQLLAEAQKGAEVLINENFQTIQWAEVYGKKQPTTTGLTWGYYGGFWNGFTIADGTLTLNSGSTNYVVVARATGVLSVANTTTNWNNSVAYARAYIIVTTGSVVTGFTDYRSGGLGIFGILFPVGISADRGDTAVTLTTLVDFPTQRFATTLTGNRVVTLATTNAVNGSKFRVVRTGLGAFTLDVGGLKTIPSATAAWVDVEYDGAAWRLTGYGTL